MRILYRYVWREILPPTLVGFALFTFILLMNYLLRLARMLIEQGVGLPEVSKILLLSLPHIVVLTIPMAVLFGGLVAFGRLSGDSEVIALRAGGVSLYQLAVPALIFAGVAWLLNSYLFMHILPWGNTQLRELQWQIITSRTISAEIKPRVFNEQYPNFILYVGDTDRRGEEWRDVFVAQTDVTPPRIILAERAVPLFDEDNRVFWLRLMNGVQYAGAADPHEATVVTFDRTDLLLLDDSNRPPISGIAKDERSMTLAELRAGIAERRAAGQPYAELLVEVHKKFSFPMACLVFGLLALPLGITTRRHTKATGFMVAIGVILIYYLFVESGEKFAKEGAVPAWLGMWSANLVLAPAGLVLLWAKAREVDWGVVGRLAHAADWLQRRGSELLARVAPAASSPARGEPAAPRGGRGFPRLLDRYVFSQFARVFALTMTAFVSIWLIVEYFEIADDVYAVGDTSLFGQYFKFQLPFIVHMMIPVATLVTVLTVFSLMTKNNEVVAVLAGGTSLYRLALPILAPALLLTAADYLLQDYVLPYTNRRVAETKERLELRPTQSHQDPQQRWIYGMGDQVFHYADYDPDRAVFQGLYIYYLAPGLGRLTRTEYAEQAAWEEGAWMARHGWRRHYVAAEPGTEPRPGALEQFVLARLPVQERPEYFGREHFGPEEMPAWQLRAYIRNLERQGFDANRYWVDLHQKLAFPAVTLVMALIAVPFAFRMGRQGTLSGISVGIALAMLFWLAFVVFRAIGYAELLPPLLAAWAPHLLFLAATGYLALELPT